MDSTVALDDIDRNIVMALQRDGRLSYAQLGREVGLSATATAERVKRLEESGVIKGYQAVIDGAKVGYPMTALIRLTLTGEQCMRVGELLEGIPNVIECYRVTGEISAIAKLVIGSVAELETVVDRFASLGTPATSIVLSTPIDRRPIPVAQPTPD